VRRRGAQPDPGVKDLTEHFVSGERVFDGKLLKVHRDVVRLPDGSESAREYIRHPGAVAIVALFDDGRVLLERQFRYPQRREFIEIPAGKLEPNEPHLETAQRELAEETGYSAEQWTRLGVVHTAIAYTDESIELFLARKLSLGSARLDHGEFLETLTVPFDEAIAMVRDGRISDVKTVAALLWVDRFAEKGSEQFSRNNSAP
jgi:ADP-ribose pyrophosphatase